MYLSPSARGARAFGRRGPLVDSEVSPVVSNPAVDAFLQVNLNPAQKEAVVAPDGPLLILAGAG